MTKTLVQGALFGAALFALAAGPAGSAQAKLNRITIGANPAGTMYNTLAGGFAKIFQEKLGIQSTARPFSGSSVYLPMLQRGEITLGLNSSLDSGLSYNGKPPYSQPMSNLRALASIWKLPYMYFAKASSGLKRIEDLRGKRVVVTYRANASLAQMNRALLSTGGLTESDIHPVTVAGVPQGLNAVVEGRADSATIALGIALLQKAHATVPGGIRILGMGHDEAALSKNMPGAWVDTTTPRKGNVGVDAPTRIGMFFTFLNTGVHVSDEDAYNMVKTLHENWADLQKDYPALRNVQADELASPRAPHPYHPGAIKYFKEIGLWSAENEKNQMMVLKMR